jgi:hypothetical protein
MSTSQAIDRTVTTEYHSRGARGPSSIGNDGESVTTSLDRDLSFRDFYSLFSEEETTLFLLLFGLARVYRIECVTIRT